MMIANPQIFPGTKVAVMGLGVSGRAAVKYALQQKAEIFISDIRPEDRFTKEESSFINLKKIHKETGKHTVEFLAQAEMVILSPGISARTPLMDELRSRGVKIVGELAFAPALVDKPIVAITGTNGKTTVTTLVGELLEGGGQRVFVGGNIGTSLFDYLCDSTEYDVLVLEVSSFQLETAGSFSPTVAIILNISPDHLDRHGSFSEYQKSKMKIFSNQHKGDKAILNGDDLNCEKLAANLLADIYRFGVGKDCDAVISESDVIVYLNGETEKYSLASTLLQNITGASNSAPAILAARFLGCSPTLIQGVLNGFSPLEHRMEFVKKLDGVAYYNDSKATNTGAVAAALNQLPGQVVLIAGGRDKGDDYTLLKQSVSEKVKTLILIGESSDLMEKALREAANIVKVKSMKDAVKMSAKFADQGDSVLLSPACASFDMFDNYGHRGRVFKEEIELLREVL